MKSDEITRHGGISEDEVKHSIHHLRNWFRGSRVQAARYKLHQREFHDRIATALRSHRFTTISEWKVIFTVIQRQYTIYDISFVQGPAILFGRYGYGHDGRGVCLSDSQTVAYLKNMGMTELGSVWAMVRGGLSRSGRGDALLRRISRRLTWLRVHPQFEVLERSVCDTWLLPHLAISRLAEIGCSCSQLTRPQQQTSSRKDLWWRTRLGLLWRMLDITVSGKSVSGKSPHQPELYNMWSISQS